MPAAAEYAPTVEDSEDAAPREAKRPPDRLLRKVAPVRLADPERLKPIVLLGLVVGLQSADGGTVGALVVSLKQALHINDIQVGLLVTVSTGVGALATVSSRTRR